MSKPAFRLYSAIAACWIFLFISPLSAQNTITPPELIGTSTNPDGPTLAIPRWKGYMSESNPAHFWVTYANASTNGNNIQYSTDSGSTWSTNNIYVGNDGGLNFHVSLFGKNEELYYTAPGASIIFRKFNFPAHSNADRGPLISIPGTNTSYRSNIMVQDNDRIWLFTRLTGDQSQNVRYSYSDNNGSSWTQGIAYATNNSEVRIGSMPYINGNPALLVLYISSNRGYEYYLWNGSSFEAKNDHSIYPVNMSDTRSFTFNSIQDTTMHLIFGLGNDLHHLWKNYNNGNGSWNHSIIDSSPYTSNNDWYNISTVKGDKLYLFYSKKSNSAFSSSQIYCKIWSQSTQSWTAPALVSAAITANRDPNTCFHVPDTANYIPVFWWSGEGTTKNIYFSKIILETEIDTIPPGPVLDLRGGN
jgi:hypothetical protein